MTKGGRPPARSLETPKIPKRIPKYLTLEESVRLLIASEFSARNHCIITIFLNCALRLSELTSLDVGQVSSDTLQVIGKGNKERKIFLTSATKKALEHWLKERKRITTSSTALFITKKGNRMTGRSVQDVVKRYIKLAILEHKNISVHKFRHTAATLMYQYGKVDIRSLQQILGHESLEEAFLLYENRDKTLDLEALRMDIYRVHKGLSHLTLSPVFRAQYSAKNGFFSISFRKQNGKVLVARWVEEQKEKELVTKK